jgi:hypothetical protein
MVSPYSLILFGGRIFLEEKKNMLKVDNWIKFKMDAAVCCCALVCCCRCKADLHSTVWLLLLLLYCCTVGCVITAAECPHTDCGDCTACCDCTAVPVSSTVTVLLYLYCGDCKLTVCRRVT